MIGSNLDIMNPGWREIIFKDRNQAYGAYQLRLENPRNTNRALLIAVSFFVFVLALPTIINKINGFIPKADERIKETTVVLEQPKLIDETHVTPPPAREPARPHNSTIKFPPPVVRPDPDVREADPPTIEMLKNNDPSQQTLKGDDKAPINIDEPKGTSTDYSATEGTGENNGTGIFREVEIQPTFPGGEAAFGKFLQSHIRYPAIAKEANVSGRVFLQFVVEKNGSLTDVKAVRDPGSGLGDEAMRVLRMSPRWNPGIQNGRFVRVQYTIPVNFSLGE